MKNVKIGVIGLGGRGYSVIKDTFSLFPFLTVSAVCDLFEDRRDRAADAVVEVFGSARPKTYADYRELIDDPDVDCVSIMTGWDTHVDIAVYAMKAGKPVALEVGGSYSVEDCWKLVNTYEETKTPFMFMENCCYDRREMMVQNMVKLGKFGEIVHCAGMYGHDLRHEITFGKENRHYRLRNYMNRNCENYPTHELGPIAKLLNINNGNRMLTLTSTASKAAGLSQFVKDNKSDDEELMNTKFAQGDIVTTLIKCNDGSTIMLTLDTSLPRYYSRGFTVRGTKGFYEEATDSVYIYNGAELTVEWRNAKNFEEEYDHPIWREHIANGSMGGHGGMDYLEYNAFFESLIENKPMPIDVYDAAAWMCITPLSEESIRNGSNSVTIPDFTRGKWIKNYY